MSVQNIDSGTQDLLVYLEDGVLTITLNRPEARNAFSPDLLKAFNKSSTHYWNTTVIGKSSNISLNFNKHLPNNSICR